MKINRRSFIKTGLAGAALAAVGCKPNVAETPNEVKTTAADNKFHLSCADWTFHLFDIDTALQTLQKCDIHYLCIKDFHLPLDATEEQIKAFHAKCAEYGVTGYGVGPIYQNTEEEVDKAFEYTRKVGAKVMLSVPPYELLPYVDKKIKEYPEIKYAIHLHGPDLDVYQDATVIWDKVKDLDPRIGMCLDIGHDFRNGADPVADLEKYHTRVFDMHIKDETDNSKAGQCVEMGRGKIDFPAFVRMMRKVGYDGMCSLEYEKDMDNPFIGIAESYGYMKAVCKLA
ncbi:MAG: sugar phosphate isomerase/epimerase [Bacteroidaceae bacterium]|jgi:sugar phosphate isomerase/epimerase|nr:sugar phosphate isomerase/epimerase [Bacteroidaceae bacterium]MBQ8484641.1 sugar phosphate isomerase/epimerase [Bacteroidaceae bacterium]MBQ9676312.1 sugar phosphate isomerase/epimerase [Bacteroidaceae bacterium]